MSMFGRPPRKPVLDFLRGVEPERLKLIGAISLSWNAIETGLDAVMIRLLGIDVELAAEVESRINGVEGKWDIVKAALKKIDPEDTLKIKPRLGRTINSLADYKQRRDRIAHMRIYYTEDKISSSFKRKGKELKIGSSISYLNELYGSLHAYFYEFKAFHYLVDDLYKWHRLPEGQRHTIEERLLERRTLFLECQNYRESIPLPPLEPEPAVGLSALLLAEALTNWQTKAGVESPSAE